MKLLISIFLCTFVSSAFGMDICPNFSGRYLLSKKCEVTNYSGQGMLFPLQKTLGVISVGSTLIIDQKNCDSVVLGTERRLPDGTVFTSQNMFSGGLEFIGLDSLKFKFNSSELPFSVFKGKVKIINTAEGISFSMSSESWNAVFQPSPSRVSNTCSLLKI